MAPVLAVAPRLDVRQDVGARGLARPQLREGERVCSLVDLSGHATAAPGAGGWQVPQIVRPSSVCQSEERCWGKRHIAGGGLALISAMSALNWSGSSRSISSSVGPLVSRARSTAPL